MKHTPETVDVRDDHCWLTCHCGDEFNDYSWEAVGRKFDEHVNEIGVYEDGEGSNED